MRERTLAEDAAWRRRAQAVIPNGMYGHQSARGLPEGFPQFLDGGSGCHIRDVDGNEYIDFMCSYGPIILGHAHPKVEEAARAQLSRADCQNGPAPVMVELAELLVATVGHAGWAMFAKNGTDATTMCVTIARAATGKRKVLVAEGAYHGAAPWCTPVPAGVVAEDRAHLVTYKYNDLQYATAAAERCWDDLAAIVVSPFRHDARVDQEMVDPAFARHLREICDSTGAALILDEVRAGFRLTQGSSWQSIGVEPDLSAWSKAIANGYPLSAVLGGDHFREAAGRIFVTGSFWFSAVPMAAAVATIHELRDLRAQSLMQRTGSRLVEGLASQARSHSLGITLSGPPQMPFMTFSGDEKFAMANVWSATAARRGAYFHPWHNWFLSAAHSDEDIDRALDATEEAFAEVRRRFGHGG